MKFAAAQIESKLGSIEENVEKHIAWTEHAFDSGAALVAFPELSLSGYFLGDRFEEIALSTDELCKFFQGKFSPSVSIYISVGFPEQLPDSQYACSQAVLKIDKGDISHISTTRKYLPSFFNTQHSGADQLAVPFLLSELPVATLIGKDMMSLFLPLSFFPGDTSPAVLLVPAASVSRGYRDSRIPGNLKAWETILSFYSSHFLTFVINSQKVGVEDSFIFAGGSGIYLPDATVISGPLFEEALVTAELDISNFTAQREKKHLSDYTMTEFHTLLKGSTHEL